MACTTPDERSALRSALVHAVGTICEEDRGKRGLAMDPTAVATMAFAVEQFVKVMAADLVAFRNYKEKSVIGVDEALLFVRRSAEARQSLRDFIESEGLMPAPRKSKKPAKAKAAANPLTKGAPAPTAGKIPPPPPVSSLMEFDDDFFVEDFDDNNNNNNT
eukprot:CAMPEP_0118917920 /NCGR_PEP_ID=MMETSP1166-20130328/17600_1 /TAXON_ID=1104430 /ORGANISM="Chrysoreinhardia sp, Strain CCMP3193" /LENGTH=160 /DNA_ID=CAMNT_0006858145 /DNA_START=15 /DNA_END=497 /DNA_ORIENTATION=+